MPAIAGWFRSRGVAALPGYSIFDTPWAGVKTNTGWSTRGQSSGRLAGGLLQTDSAAQNNLFTEDRWFDTGTFKWAQIHESGPDRGIYNVTGISGTQTVDGYSAGVVTNVYGAEVAGIAVTAGLKTVQVSMATKNASSSAYYGLLNTWAAIRTGP